MKNRFRLRTERLYQVSVVLILLGLPLLLWSYDRAYWRQQTGSNAKVFTLTGHTTKGWILGDVQAYQTVVSGLGSFRVQHPVIRVRLGDRVILKLKSSDVIHGFSMKDAGIFVTDGIHPGKVKVVTFDADREGVFAFSCNAICGDNHEHMQGRIIVSA